MAKARQKGKRRAEGEGPGSIDEGVVEEARRQEARRWSKSDHDGDGWYSRVTDDELADENYWKKMCPFLSCCSDKTMQFEPSDASAHDETSQHLRTCLIAEGVARYNPQRVQHKSTLIRNLANGIRTLHAHGFDASFILMYDEVWELALAIRDDIEAMMAVSRIKLASHSKTTNAQDGQKLVCNFDILAWHVAPGDPRTSAFSPHRDRQPDDLTSSFYKDSMPKYLTAWIALSHASPDSSCLYCVPANIDEGYHHGDEEDPAILGSSPLDVILHKKKEAYQDIRALTCADGEGVLFSHRLIHWGSRGTSMTSSPRISISFGFSDPSFEHPYFDEEEKLLKTSSSLPLALRLSLIAGQLITYYQRFDIYSSKLERCRTLFMRNTDAFHEEYRRKVSYEIVMACKLMNQVSEGLFQGFDDAGDPAASNLATNRDEDNEDALDVAMQTYEPSFPLHYSFTNIYMLLQQCCI